jgi:hypothetical protein
MVVLLAGVWAVQSAAPAPVPYETFCAKDRTAKQALLKTMTAEQKATLWRTQVERFQAANDSRLTPEQRALLKEFIAIIPEGVAAGPPSLETRTRLAVFEGRLEAGFSREDRRTFDNYGPCIAVKK